MKKQTVIFALASVITLGCVFFTGLPAAQGGQPYAPWIGLKNNLEQAKSSSPDNYAVPYYLGLVYLREGNRNGAIQEWESYLGLAPEDFKSVSIRERLTILKLDQAAEHARQAVGKGMKAQERKPVDNSLAVFNFKNLATAEFIPFIKALTMTIITDLSKVPQLVLVERIKVQALVDEMNLGTTGIVDPETASKAGGFLLAKHITWGEVGSSQQDSVRITAKVGQTLSSSNPVDVHAEGAKAQFFELEKKIVFGIIEALGLTKEELSSPVRKTLEKHHTKNFKAFMLFGTGLDHLDRKDFAEAKAAFEKAGQADPGFGLNTTMEQATPKSAITVTAVENMVVFEGEEEMALDNTGEEASPPSQFESVGQSLVIDADRAGKEISDIAQEQQEVQTQQGNITVRW